MGLMFKNGSNVVSKGIETFLASIPPKYYGMGRDVHIPCSAELLLLEMFMAYPPSSRADFDDISERLSMQQAYSVGVFSVRMATHAVRSRSIPVLCAACFGIVIDANSLDWRDVLLGLTVLDDAANRLGAAFEAIMQAAIKVASDPRRETIKEYFERPPELRDIGVMGIEALGSGVEFEYRAKPFVP